MGVLHHASRAAIEFAGGADFASGAAPALARPVLSIDGVRHELANVPIAWERALGWIPTFTCTIADVVVRGTIFAPYGRDADLSGAVVALSLENRRGAEVAVEVSLVGTFGHRQLRVRTPRRFDDATRVARGPSGSVLLHGASLPEIAALAVVADADADIAIDGASYSLRRTVRIPPAGREQVAFYLAVGPEPDGAEATAGVLRRRGWRELLSSTRDALQSLEQSTGTEAVDRLINRNLLFAYFYAVGRALDDAQYYLVRTRAPWNGHGVTVRDWDALMWTIPAVQLADPALARELLLRMCELHGYAPGRGVHYLDGTLFEPGFALEGVAAYPLAADRYIRDTGDDRVVDEPALADTLYLVADDLDARRDKRAPLYSTEVSPSGVPVAYPFTLHANAAAAQALEVLRRTLDEETARGLAGSRGDSRGDASALPRETARGRAPSRRRSISRARRRWPTTRRRRRSGCRCTTRFRATTRPTGGPSRQIDAAPESLVRQCARLVGPDSAAVLQWLRQAPLDGGVAAEIVDADGRAVANGGDASLSGLLAWSVWYAVNALGERP